MNAAARSYRPSPSDPSRTWSIATSISSIVSAFAASICCLGPLLFALLGIGGAGLLVRLESFRPYFIAATVALLGTGFYFTYRKPKMRLASADANAECACPAPRVNHTGRVALWIATGIVAGLLSFPYLASHLLD